ncbi:MAG: Hpt domain-containing protein, partial [Pseudomonadota bacterium]
MSSALREAIDTTTLGWIKPELDETLRRAREEIEAFVDDGDAGHMRTCAGHMHQVHGTLRMVELYAPALVAEEMERLALALHRGEIDDREEACASLMRGAVLLPDYLERLQSGHRDIPIVLLPLLNELRASRGEAGLSESVLFSPDLDRPLPDYVPALQSAATVGSAPARNANQARLAALREALAAWPEDGAPGDAARLATALDALLAEVELEPLRRMLWVAASVAAALRDGVMPPSRGLRQAFGGVEREARNLLSEDHFGVPLGEPTAEPTRQLLYHVAHTAVSHPSLDALRETFDLAAHLPSERELEHARGSLSGRNRALLDTVSAAIKEDLLRVKDALDLHLRTGSGQVAELQPQVEVLARVADTLSMMGLGQAASVVLQQRDAMREIVAGRRLADESALLDVAGALLFVDAALDDQVARLGDGDAAGAAQDDLLASESRKVLDVVVREAIANFSDARQAFVAFVETNWDHSELAEVPRLLDEVGGALRILDLPGPADLLVGVKRYAERELIARRRVPSGQQLDTLADALASLEYYLEALRDRRPNRDNILDIARQSLEALGYWPLPVEEAPLPPVGAPLIEDEIAQALQLDRHTPVSFDRSALVGPTPPLVPKAPVEAANSEAAAASPTAEAPPAGASPAPVPTAPAPAPVAAGAPALGGFEHSDDIDDEIREVFLEELDEEVRNLSELLPAWHENPDDVERLRPIRRVFHTLKGSGRLVGAKTLGEFSWKIESLLNRVLDGSRPASPAVIAMVGHAYDTLPQLREALRSGAPVRADLAGLEACAERLATGEEILYMPPAPPPVAEPEPEPQAAVPAPLERDEAEADIGLEELAAEVEALVAAEEAQAETAETAGMPEAASEWSEAEALADDDWGVPAAVDSVLLEILSAEANGHLATIEQWLADAEGSADGHPATEPLRRAIHTLNGAFAMTEVPVITDITGPAETYVKRLLAAGQAADAEGVSAMTAVAAAVRRTLEALQSPMPRVPRFEGLAERIAALRDSLPEARSPMLVEPDEAPAPEVEEISPLDLTAFAPEPTIGAPRAVSAGDSIVQVAVEAEGAGFGEASAEAGDVVVPPAVPANLALVEAERLEAER